MRTEDLGRIRLVVPALFVAISIGSGCSRQEKSRAPLTTEAPGTSAPAAVETTTAAAPAELSRAGSRTAPPSVPQVKLTGTVDLTGAQVASADGQSWPLFRGTAEGTGVSTAKLPDTLELVWKRSFEKGGFESTPAIVAGVVYVGCYDGNFYALELATGNERWKFFSELGFNAPAAVREGIVYTGDTEGRFYALDAATGQAVWPAPLQTGAEINAGANFWQDKVVVGSQDASLYCLDAKSGQQVWKFTTGDMIQCSPTVVEDRAFVAGCDSKLHIVDLQTGQETAAVDILAPTGCTAAVVGDVAIFGTQGETVYCVDWRKPEAVWTWRNTKRNFPFHGSAAVTPRIAILGGRDKMIHGLDPSSGKELWSINTRGRIDGSPVLVGDRAYVGSADGRLYGIDVQRGEKVWEYDAGAGFTGSPAVVDGYLVIGTDAGDLLCFGAKPAP